MKITLKILNRNEEYVASAFLENEYYLDDNNIDNLLNSYMEEFGWDIEQDENNAISILMETLYDINDSYSENITLVDSDEVTHKLIINNIIPKYEHHSKEGTITVSPETNLFFEQNSDIVLERACVDIELE